MKHGILIAFEGNDGAGKTTAARTVYETLQSRGIDAILTREPGGSARAEKIREVILDPAMKGMDGMSEALLYAASRRQHVADTIQPALEKGQVVLTDRFLDSSLAYQGAARGLGMDTVEAINEYALQGLRPDLTLFFSLSVEEGKRRMLERGELNRMDLEEDAFHARVRQGFEEICQKNPQRTVVIDAAKSRQAVADQVMQVLKERFPFLFS